MQFHTETAYFSAYYYVYLCSLISSLLVFELLPPIVILKTEHFDNKNNMKLQHKYIKLIRQKEAGRLYNHEIVSVH